MGRAFKSGYFLVFFKLPTSFSRCSSQLNWKGLTLNFRIRRDCVQSYWVSHVDPIGGKWIQGVSRLTCTNTSTVYLSIQLYTRQIVRPSVRLSRFFPYAFLNHFFVEIKRKNRFFIKYFYLYSLKILRHPVQLLLGIHLQGISKFFGPYENQWMGKA